MPLPWMVDVHTHLFPEEIRGNRAEYARRDPVFKEIYGNEKARMVTAEELLKTMDEQEVAISVVFGFPWIDQGINREHNDYILAAAAKYPDRLVPFACFNPMDPGAEREALRCIEGGAKGIGEIAFYDRTVDSDVIEHLRPIMEILRRAGLPFLMHTNEPVGHVYPGKSMKTLSEVERLVKNFPDNTLILAHWGGGILFYELMKELKTLFRNVLYDTAASPFLYQPGIFDVAGRVVGFERILLGTDYPLIRPQRYLQQIRETVSDEANVRLICRENARRLFGLEKILVEV